MYSLQSGRGSSRIAKFPRRHSLAPQFVLIAHHRRLCNLSPTHLRGHINGKKLSSKSHTKVTSRRVKKIMSQINRINESVFKGPETDGG